MPGSEPLLIAAQMARAWAVRLSSAVEMMAQQAPDVAVSPAPAGLQPPEDGMVVSHAFGQSPAAQLDVSAPYDAWAGIAKTALSAGGIDDFDDSLLKETWEEILMQAAHGLAQEIGMRAGENIACSRSSGAPFSGQILLFEASLELAGARFGPLAVGISLALAEIWPSINETGPAGKDAAAVAAGEPADGRLPPTLELLLDVELPVSVSFGRTYLPVRDVLKLSTGSIIELDRPVNEPVEVVVNNCVIARGEVVVIDGNYGVRIHEIISRKARLALEHMTLNPYQPMRISA